MHQDDLEQNIALLVEGLQYSRLIIYGCSYMPTGEYKRICDTFYIQVKDNQCQKRWFELSSFLTSAFTETLHELHIPTQEQKEK